MDRLSRDTKWNLSLAVLILSSALAVHLAGTPWPTIGTVLVGAVVLGAVLGAVVVRDMRRRDPWQRFLREQAKAEARTRHPSSATRPAVAGQGLA